MTLTSEVNRTQAAGTGSQTSFPVSWVFWDNDDLQVVHTTAAGVETTWTRGTQFTLSDHDDGVAGTGTVDVVTTPTDYTPASGTTLTFSSILNDTQDTSLPAGGAFPSKTVETQLDKLARMIQQKSEEIGRALKLAVSASETNLTFPEFTGNSGKTLVINTAEDGLDTADIVSGGVLVSPLPVSEGGTNSITAASARTSLGLTDDAAGRATIGVEIGSDVQAYDADLTTLANHRFVTAGRLALYNLAT